MAPKPTYEDLQRRVTELEKQIAGLWETETANGIAGLWQERIFNSLEEAVLVVTPDRKLVNVNDGALRMFGYSREELASLSTAVLHVGQDQYVEFGKIIQEAFNRGEPANFEFEAKRKNGEIFPTEHTVTLLKGDQGDHIGIVSVVRDITERKQNARELEKRVEERTAELRRERDRSQQYLDVAGVMILALNEKGEIILVNKKGCEILESSEKEILGKNYFHNFLPNDAIEDVRKIFNKLMNGQTGPVEDVEERIITKNGKEKIIAWHNAVLQNEEGKIIGTLSSGEDITERKRTEEAYLNAEVRYRTLFEQSPNGILLIDTETGKMIESNETAYKQLGYTRGEFATLRVSDFETVETPEETAKHIQKVIRDGSDDFETLHRTKSGEIRNVHVCAKTVQLSDRILFYAIYQDITERKRAEETLRVSHRFLVIANRHMEMSPLLKGFMVEVQNLTGCAAVGLRMLDEESNIPYEAYVGFSRRFYESESPLSIKSDQCMCINVIKGVADTKHSFYTKGGSFYMNGTTRFLATVSEEEKGRTRNVCNQVGYESVALVPIRVENRILGLIHVADPRENMVPLEVVEVLEGIAMQLGTAIQRVRAEEALKKSHNELEMRVEERTTELQDVNKLLKQEIKGRKQAAEQIRQQRKKLTHVTRVATLGELSASLAHEINQPLTAILSNAQAAQRFLNGDKPDLEEVRDILTDIISDDKRAGEVIRRLRSLFRKDAFDLTNLDINNIIQEVIIIVKSEAIIKNIAMEVELDSVIPLVLSDRVQLQQVILNFILNASEAMADTDAGSRKMIISTRKEDEQEVKVSIRDHGTGIDEENLKRIFEPFYTTKPEGMGVGLSVNRSIIEAHGGRLWAENNPDGGATFHFTIPIYKES